MYYYEISKHERKSKFLRERTKKFLEGDLLGQKT